MAKRKAKAKREGSAQPNEASPPASPPSVPDASVGRVLVIEPQQTLRRRVARILAEAGHRCDPVATLNEAHAALGGTEYDAVVLTLRSAEADAASCMAGLRSLSPGAPIVLVGETPTAEEAIGALRGGASDLLSLPLSEEDLRRSVGDAVLARRRSLDHERRVERLKRICRRLHSARQQVTSQVDTLCNDLVGAYQQLADQVSHVTLASEFNSIIQQELDIESALRAALEYILTKTGPTNAAIFLPSNHSDFSLGAYVNYDCPRDAADVLLDHLADVIAPRFAEEERVVTCRGKDDLEEWIGDAASWLSTSTVLVCSCRHEDECLAVLALFRDEGSPYPAELSAQVQVMSDLFARQLARVVRVHHRLEPEREWTGWDDWESDEDDDVGGLAA